MSFYRLFLRAAVPAAVLVSLTFGIAAADELPKATQAVLQQLKLKPEILKGLDAELAVPADWIEAAKKQPTVKITGSDDVPLYTQRSEEHTSELQSH